MISTILGIIFLHSDGTVQDLSPKHRTENYYNNYCAPVDRMAQLEQKMEKYNSDSHRMLDQSNQYYRDQQLFDLLR
jgi:hypothetical protein